MKVKVITNYNDKVLKKELTAGKIIEVESEQRLKELLGGNREHIVCVEVIEEEPKEPKAEADIVPEKTPDEEGLESENLDENPAGNVSDETEEKPKTKLLMVNQKVNKKNAKKQ